MKEYIKKLNVHLIKIIKYTGWIIVQPKKALESLILEKYQVHYTITLFLISVLLFMPILVGASLTLKPEGWTNLLFKIPQNMIYVYFMLTAPLSILLNIASLGTIYFVAIFLKKDNISNTNLFSTTQFSLTMVVIYDFIIEAFAIIYFWISKANIFPRWLITTMYFNYGIMFLWTIFLLIQCSKIVLKTNWWQSIIVGILATITYWLLMGLWIA